MPKIKESGSIMKKVVLTLAVLLVLALVVLGFIYWDKIFGRSYVAVHLTNGDTYFGQLYRFPKLQLGDVHVIQPMADPNDSTKTILQVVPLNLVAFWGPDKLQLNRDQVIFIGKVGSDSQVMQVIKKSKEAAAAQPTQ
jgi:hypothetical protein